jgi:predicted GIY-YIG superfamily endonuclease
MPKTHIDYSKCVIYRIVCKDVNIKDCYVGQTTNLTKRRGQHKSDCKHAYRGNAKVYKFIKENGGFDNWSVIEIEKYPCSSHDEAQKRERYWMEKYNATLNAQLTHILWKRDPDVIRMHEEESIALQNA